VRRRLDDRAGDPVSHDVVQVRAMRVSCSVPGGDAARWLLALQVRGALFEGPQVSAAVASAVAPGARSPPPAR
jgi:hypothetical protein